MAKDLTNEQDVKASKKATQTKGTYLKIEEGRTPIYLLDSKYQDGFVHWVTLPDGSRTSIPCGGGEMGNGYAPDECPICAYMKDQYAMARAMEQGGRKGAAKELRNATNRMRANYQMVFLAAKGELAVTGFDENGKKKYGVDFEDAQIGLLTLSKKQRDDLLAVPATQSHIDGTADLLNRYIIFDKRKRGEDEYATIEFLPAKKPTPKPEYEVPEGLDMDKMFEPDMEQLTKIVALLSGEEVEDEEVDFEDDEDEDEEVLTEDETEEDDEEEELEEADELEDDDEEEDDDLTFDEDDEEDDDLDLDSDADSEPTSEFDDSFLDDVDDDFDDDLPWEKDEEEPAIPAEDKPKKKAKKKTPPAKTDF